MSCMKIHIPLRKVSLELSTCEYIVFRVVQVWTTSLKRTFKCLGISASALVLGLAQKQNMQTCWGIKYVHILYKKDTLLVNQKGKKKVGLLTCQIMIINYTAFFFLHDLIYTFIKEKTSALIVVTYCIYLTCEASPFYEIDIILFLDQMCKSMRLLKWFI